MRNGFSRDAGCSRDGERKREAEMHAIYLLESLNLFASSDLAKKSFNLKAHAAARTRARAVFFVCT
jgi:hypothetical protein